MTSDTTGSKGASTQDALQLLRADHRRIEALLDDCTRLASDETGSHSSADRSGLVARLGALLQSHAQVELELFYPALDATPESVEVARQEHACITELLGRVVAAEQAHPAFGQQVAALGQAVRAHVSDEEEHLFATAGSMDLQAVGARMAVRRAELMGEQGVD
jgi:Hemerythrin HHE cation binding domain